MKHYNSVRLFRDRLGLTQKELAFAVDVSVNTISSIERGQSIPRADLAESLARVLGCSFEDIFFYG